MSENIEKFRAKVSRKFVQGEQNKNMLVIVNNAKFYNLEENEALAEIKGMWQGKFEKADEKSFKNAWKNPKTEPTSHYGDFKKQEEKSTSEAEMNHAFKNFIESTAVCKNEYDVTDTSLLKWWFKKSDWIFIVRDRYDMCNLAQDCLSLMKNEKPLKNWQFMSIASFNDPTKGRKTENVSENRLVLLECDSLPLDTQLKFFSSLVEFKLPVKSIVFSGSKSVHCLLKIHPMKDHSEYKQYCEKIHNEFNKLYPKLVDTANKDSVRYTRSPFGYREDKEKVQKLIWCDEIAMDDETFEFEDTLQQVEKYVEQFTCQKKEFKKIVDVNGRTKFEFMSVLSTNCEIEDSFMNNGVYMAKLKGKELMKMSKNDIWDNYNWCIDKEAREEILKGKDEKHKTVTMNDFVWKAKDIVYDITMQKSTDDIFNMYEPGFYTECTEINPGKMPEEFEKLLDNIADEKCKDWLVNHLACYFQLLKNGFNHPLKGQRHTLETIPVFYGKSGTGKNTLLNIIGQAICSKGAEDISIGSLNDDFNEFYKAGLININEAAKGKSERRASKEALKRFTDIWKQLNQKFMPKVTLFNGAYKTISANESDFGVLDIDVFDRRFQYITGGGQKGVKYHVFNTKILEEQKKEFIGYLLHYQYDFNKADRVFDNAAKEEDKLNSMSVPEKVAYWIWENSEVFTGDYVSIRTGLEKYNMLNGTKADPDPRILGKCLSKYFPEKSQWGKSSDATFQRGEIVYSLKSKMKTGIDLEEL